MVFTTEKKYFTCKWIHAVQTHLVQGSTVLSIAALRMLFAEQQVFSSFKYS